MTKTIELGSKEDGRVRVVQDDEGFSFYVLDGNLFRGEWVPWAEAASWSVIENCVRGLPEMQTRIKEDRRKDWKWNARNVGKTQLSERKVRNFMTKIQTLLEG